MDEISTAAFAISETTRRAAQEASSAEQKAHAGGETNIKLAAGDADNVGLGDNGGV